MTEPKRKFIPSDERIDAVLGMVERMSRMRELAYDIRCLRAWRDLAVKPFGFTDGARVVIKDTWAPKTSGGWAHYYECMAPGQTGVVREMVIHPDDLRVSALTMWDTEWATWSDLGGGGIRRTLREPDDRHVFYFPAEHLRLATDTDLSLQMPVAVSS